MRQKALGWKEGGEETRSLLQAEATKLGTINHDIGEMLQDCHGLSPAGQTQNKNGGGEGIFLRLPHKPKMGTSKNSSSDWQRIELWWKWHCCLGDTSSLSGLRPAEQTHRAAQLERVCSAPVGPPTLETSSKSWPLKTWPADYSQKNSSPSYDSALQTGLPSSQDSRIPLPCPGVSMGSVLLHGASKRWYHESDMLPCKH